MRGRKARNPKFWLAVAVRGAATGLPEGNRTPIFSLGKLTFSHWCHKPLFKYALRVAEVVLWR
jgi:hypothetical protein